MKVCEGKYIFFLHGATPTGVLLTF